MKKLLTSLLFIGLVSSAQAGLINGGFETGDTTGWTANPSHYVSVVSTATAADGTIYTPTEGDYFAVLQAGNLVTQLSQTFKAVAGTALSFDYAFLSFDWFNDNASQALVAVNSDGSEVPVQAQVLGSTSQVGTYGDSGWLSTSILLPDVSDTDFWKIMLSSVNYLDPLYDSYLLIDNFELSGTVSSPPLLALLFIGLVALGLVSWRKPQTRSAGGLAA